MEAPYSHPERAEDNSLQETRLRLESAFLSGFLEGLLSLCPVPDFLSSALKRALSDWLRHCSISLPHPIGQALRFSNHVCHQMDRLTQGGGTAILVWRNIIDHYAVLLSGLQHLEDTAIHLVLANRPVKLMACPNFD
jgi:hypothetical protein